MAGRCSQPMGRILNAIHRNGLLIRFFTQPFALLFPGKTFSIKGKQLLSVIQAADHQFGRGRKKSYDTTTFQFKENFPDDYIFLACLSGVFLALDAKRRKQSFEYWQRIHSASHDFVPNLSRFRGMLSRFYPSTPQSAKKKSSVTQAGISSAFDQLVSDSNSIRMLTAHSNR